MARPPHVETCVRMATARDAGRVLGLLDSTLRCYMPYGQEDLRGLATRHQAWLAEAAGSLRGVLCISQKTATIAEIRALCISDGWRSDSGVQTLLSPVLVDLSAEGVRSILCIGAAAWLVPPLQRYGFELVDRVVFLESQGTDGHRGEVVDLNLRPIRPNDLSALAELDSLSFEELWRYDRGNFMEVLVTREYSIVAEMAGALVGYAISDTVNGDGYLVRIAVHPDYRHRGVGGRLLQDCLDHCLGGGANRVILNTQESNVASLMLYETFGFRRFGRRVPVLVREL